MSDGTEHEDETESTQQLVERPRRGPWVVEVASPGGTQWLELRDGSQLVLGSSRSSDAVVADPTVSARHVRLEASDEGVRVDDLDSRNGLYVGAARVPRALLSGQHSNLVVGQTTISVRSEDGSLHIPARVEPIPGLVGDSPAMRVLIGAIRRYAPLKAPVLIQGESGTGKDLVSTALHELSARRGRYVPLNVAALSGALVDSELFGHERGAFTGAVAKSLGAFVAANRGTLFLDEVAELTPAIQAKLLRVVEEQIVHPVGSVEGCQVQVRIVSATWQPMRERVAQGLFREDLYHRISTVVLEIPPLRNRKGDLPAIAGALLERLAPELGRKRLASGAIGRLVAYSWPGNVRELASVLYRACMTNPGSELVVAASIDAAIPKLAKNNGPTLTTADARALLSAHDGNASAAARTANVARSTFRGWLR